jgi:hypothetical protein
LTTHCEINIFKWLQVQSKTIFPWLFQLWSMWGVSRYYTRAQIGMTIGLCVIIWTHAKVSLNPFWISWLFLKIIATPQKSLPRIIIEGTLGKNQCLKMFNFFVIVFKKKKKKGSPTTIWVNAYLGGTTKNHPPQNHRNVGFILINERTNF